MKVVDIRACSELVHEQNKDIVVVVDNTFMSAYFQVRVTDVHFTLFWFWNGALIISCTRTPAQAETWLLINSCVLSLLSAPCRWEPISACIQPPNTWTVGWVLFLILQKQDLVWLDVALFTVYKNTSEWWKINRGQFVKKFFEDL